MEKETNRNMASAGTPRAVSSLSSLYKIPGAYNGLYMEFLSDNHSSKKIVSARGH